MLLHSEILHDAPAQSLSLSLVTSSVLPMSCPGTIGVQDFSRFSLYVAAIFVGLKKFMESLVCKGCYKCNRFLASSFLG